MGTKLYMRDDPHLPVSITVTSKRHQKVLGYKDDDNPIYVAATYTFRRGETTTVEDDDAPGLLGRRHFKQGVAHQVFGKPEESVESLTPDQRQVRIEDQIERFRRVLQEQGIMGPDEQEDVASPERKVCPACATENAGDAIYCQSCGSRFA